MYTVYTVSRSLAAVEPPSRRAAKSADEDPARLSSLQLTAAEHATWSSLFLLTVCILLRLQLYARPSPGASVVRCHGRQAGGGHARPVAAANHQHTRVIY